MASNNNLKIKKDFILLFKTPKDESGVDPYMEVRPNYILYLFGNCVKRKVDFAGHAERN